MTFIKLKYKRLQPVEQKRSTISSLSSNGKIKTEDRIDDDGSVPFKKSGI